MNFLIALAVMLLAMPCPAETFAGKVTRILDGDTIELVTADHRQVRIRAADIDAPEKAQAWGQAAKQAMAALVFGKTVQIEGRGLDRYGRTIGVIWEDGVEVNEEMVREGMAWTYPAYNRDPTLPAIEAEARAARRGLWYDAQPEAPWLFRRSQR